MRPVRFPFWPKTVVRSGLFLASLAASAAFAAPSLEIRFYPDRELRVQTVNPQRGVADALLQNLAVIARGEGAVTLDSVTIDLLSGGQPVQTLTIAGAGLEAQAARAGRLAAAGMIDAYSFQFQPAKLLAGAKVVGSSTLSPGEALLVGHRVISIQGAGVDRLRVTARGKDSAGGAVSGTGELAVRAGGSANSYLFPLAGNWFVGAGPSFQSHHRWVVPEEFALDIARIGDGGKTFRGAGATNADYFGWEAEVRAAADGKVVSVVDKFEDSDEVLRKAGESEEAYGARMAQAQATLFAQGLEAIGGNVVVIEHANGEYSHYAHLRHGSVRVKPGEAVKAGQPIAKLGDTGNSTEPHLHFQVTDGPATLGSAGIPIRFERVTILLADAPRELQSGDVVDAK